MAVRGRDLRLIAKFDVSNVRSGFEAIRKQYAEYERMIAGVTRAATSQSDARVAVAKKEAEEIRNVYIGNRSRLAPDAAGLEKMNEAYQRELEEYNRAVKQIADKARESREAREAQERAVTASMQAETKRRAKVKQEEVYELTAYDKELLRITRDTGMAKAHAENNQFDRDIERLRAQANYKLTLAKGDVEKMARVQEWATERYIAIEKRREQFANTPFQKMLTNQGAFITMMQRMGLSAKQAGQTIQQAGYQVGDFAVQVASGQGVLRPFIQQSNQLLGAFGPWGAVLGAAAATLGALYVGLKKSKDEAKGLASTDLPKWLTDAASIQTASAAIANFAAVEAALAAEIQRTNASFGLGSRGIMVYSHSTRKATEEAKRFKEATGTSIEEFRKQVEQFMTLGDAVAAAQQAAYSKQIDAIEDYNRTRIEAMEDGLAKSEKLEEQSYARQVRAAQDAYAKVILDTKSTFEERRKAQADYVVVSAALEAAHNQRLANLRAEDAKKQREEREKLAQELHSLEVQTQRMRIETTMAGSARAIALTNAEYDERVRAAKGHAAAVNEIEKQRQLALAAHQEAAIRAEVEGLRAIEAAREASNQRRLEALAIGNEQELLAIRQQSERRRVAEEYNAQLIRDIQEGNYALIESRYAAHQEALSNLAVVHEAERAEVSRKAAEERAKKIAEANNKLAQSYLVLGNEIADAFNVGPMKEALAWLQRIQRVLQAIESIRAATKALSLLSAPVNPLGALFGGLFANGGAVPKYAGGGPIRGPSHSSGGVLIEAEGGEHILDRRDVRNLGGHDAIYAMRRNAESGRGRTAAKYEVNITLTGSATQADAQRVAQSVLPALRRFESERESAPFYRAQGVN